ncbi:MAG: leucine-rich repeat protein [Treponema sp.]|nr:leucine-rich repeat protein [Treponema sp.]
MIWRVRNRVQQEHYWHGRLYALCALVLCVPLVVGCPNGGGGNDVPSEPTAKTYTVTYSTGNIAGVTGKVPAAQIKKEGDVVLIAGNSGNLERAGYIFKGWNTDPDGDGTTYWIDYSFDKDVNITLYPFWYKGILVEPGKTSEEIGKLTESWGVVVEGEATAEDLKSIIQALKAKQTATPGVLVSLDLTGVTGIEEIGKDNDHSFKGITNLEKIELPSGVTTLYQSAFEGCDNLREVIIGDTVTKIEADAFRNATRLETVVYKAASMPRSTFKGCSALKTVTIGKKCKEIGRDAFENCPTLETVTFEASTATWAWDDGSAYDGVKSWIVNDAAVNGARIRDFNTKAGLRQQ